MKWISMVVGLCLSLNVWAYSFFDSEQPIDNMIDAWAKAVYELEDVHRAELLETIWQALDTHHEEWEIDQAYPLWAGIILSDLSFEKGWVTGYPLAKEAKQLLLEIVDSEDKTYDALAYAALGRLYAYSLPWPFGFADQGQAETYFEKSVLLAPNSLDIQFWLARFMIYQGDDTAAIEALKAVVQMPNPAEHAQANQIRKQWALTQLKQLDPDYSEGSETEEATDSSV